MSEGVTSLRHQITNAEELDSVVRSMKTQFARWMIIIVPCNLG